MWASAVVGHSPQYSSILRCFAAHHECHEWLLNYSSLPVSSNLSEAIPLWPLPSTRHFCLPDVPLFFTPLCVIYLPGDQQFLKSSKSACLAPTTMLGSKSLRSHFIWCVMWPLTEALDLYSTLSPNLRLLLFTQTGSRLYNVNNDNCQTIHLKAVYLPVDW